MKKWKKGYLIILGVFLIFLGVSAIALSIMNKNYDQILWICYDSLILIGIGCLIGNSYLIASQLNILTLPILIWNIDFFYVLITGNTLWGITNYYFDTGFLNFSRFISLQHLVVIPLALYALYTLKIKRKDAWKLSLIQIVLLFSIIYFFVPPTNNVNCIFKPCINYLIPYLNGIAYNIFWFVGYIIMILLTNFLLIKLFYVKITITREKV